MTNRRTGARKCTAVSAFPSLDFRLTEERVTALLDSDPTVRELRGTVPKRYHGAIAMLMLRGYSPLPNYRHRFRPDCISISSRALRGWFGHDQKRIELVVDTLFEVPDRRYSPRHHATIAYQLRPMIREAIGRRSVTRPAVAPFTVDAKGRRHRPFRSPKSRRHRHRHGKVSWSLPTYSTIDPDLLQRVADVLDKWTEYGTGGRRSAPRELRHEMNQIHRNQQRRRKAGTADPKIDPQVGTNAVVERLSTLCAGLLDFAPKGCPHLDVPMSFRQAGTGRWYGTSTQGPNVQGLPRLLRRAVFHGAHEYDIVTLNHSILMQVAERAGISCPTLRRLVADKNAFRKDLARSAGITVGQAKTVCTALSYRAATPSWGVARRSMNEYHERANRARPCFSLVGEVGIVAYGRLLGIRSFLDLRDEMAEVFEHLLASAERSKRGDIVNAVGKRIAWSENPHSQRRIAAHLLQGIESLALSALLDAMPSAQLPIHDAVITCDREDAAAAEVAIEERTGFRLRLDETRLALEL